MRLISDPAAASAVLHHPAFVVPPVPPARTGIGWLRATVGRFSTGPDHVRRRALSITVLAAVAPESLRAAPAAHPVTTLARATGVGHDVVALVRDAAQAYQPHCGDAARADTAVDRLVALLGGAYDETTAARIGVLVQAGEPTAALIDRARHRPVDEVLTGHPPVPETRRQALAPATVGGVTVEAGEVVRVGLAGGLAFGAGPRRCPGRRHALALVDGARA